MEDHRGTDLVRAELRRKLPIRAVIHEYKTDKGTCFKFDYNNRGYTVTVTAKFADFDLDKSLTVDRIIADLWETVINGKTRYWAIATSGIHPSGQFFE